jgi:hypothetical protein
MNLGRLVDCEPYTTLFILQSMSAIRILRLGSVVLVHLGEGLDFIGNKDYSFVYPQITQIFADFSFENSLICVISEICGLFPIMSILFTRFFVKY